MPDVAAVLREEIARLARREVKQQVGPLKKTIAEQRRTIAALRRQIAVLARSPGFPRAAGEAPARRSAGGQHRQTRSLLAEVGESRP